MKKITAIVLVLFLVATLGTGVMAVEPSVKHSLNYEIPKTAAAPAIDGNFTPAKWAGALVIDWTGNPDLFMCNQDDTKKDCSATFYFVWDEKGIYFAADVKDSTRSEVRPEVDEGYNKGDGPQFFIYAGEGAWPSDVAGFTFHPERANGTPGVWEHFAIGAEDTAAKIASKFKADGSGYIVEGMMPASTLLKTPTPFKLEAGTKFPMVNALMDETGEAQYNIFDGAWLDQSLDDMNKYTLSANVAHGKAPAAPAAGKNPFARMTATEDNVAGGPNGSHETKENPDALYDASKLFQLYWDTNSDYWAHGGVNTIAFLDPYGIGYGHERGVVYIENLDFGANGANKVTVQLTNTTEPFGGLGIYIDANPIKDANAKPLAVIKDVLTDGYEDVNALDYTVDINIPGGVHTVYFMYLGPNVGSLFSVVFGEAPPPPPPPAGEQPAPEQPAAPTPEQPAPTPAPAAPAAPAPAAPPTGDSAILAFAALVLALAAAVVLVRRRLHN